MLLAVTAALVVVLGLLVADGVRRVVEGDQEQATEADFYALPTAAPLPSAEPGTVIRSERIASAPEGMAAWRVIYHSVDQAGADIPVSAVVVAPDAPAPGGGRTVVGWGHPTTGAATHCAPSLAADPFSLIEGLHELIAAGYVVTATDYPGLGVAGASSYLLGVPESNSLLDSVRAAQQIDGTGAGSSLLLWGHSQGGQAALFAAERAGDYAPELDLKGVAVAAPAADLTALMSADIVDVSGVTIASYAIPAYQAAYAAEYPATTLDAILTPAGAEATPKMAALCLLSENAELHAIAGPLIGGYVTSDPATTEPWQTLLQANSAGNAPITVPVFVGQGLSDALVVPSSTRAYVASLCAAGTDVVFRTFPGVDHGLAAYAALPEVLPWFAAVDGGRTPASTC